MLGVNAEAITRLYFPKNTGKKQGETVREAQQIQEIVCPFLAGLGIESAFPGRTLGLSLSDHFLRSPDSMVEVTLNSLEICG